MARKRSEKAQRRRQNWQVFAEHLRNLPKFRADIERRRKQLNIEAIIPDKAKENTSELGRDRDRFWEYVLMGKLPSPKSPAFQAIALDATEKELQSFPPYPRQLMEDIRLSKDAPAEAKDALNSLLEKVEQAQYERFDRLEKTGYPLIYELMWKWETPLSWAQMLFEHTVFGYPLDADLVNPCPVVVDYSQIDTNGRKRVLLEVFPETTEEELREAYQDAKAIHKKRFLAEVGKEGLHYLSSKRIREAERLQNKARAFSSDGDVYRQAYRVYGESETLTDEEAKKLRNRLRQMKSRYKKRYS
ncbi:MAG: hypothetical protein COT71_00550 [Candidatus Andersenbacteria bacterium CG10_big_fil_rev_8_21_14_0_10_54_11]|uniref:Uncharacterized protein n=1 Tax=Candidatus Andersenbacteria bacterium CG10_big_fil_rev_8_21_14_0_10_54_11 TaxID=1974485 RepID=A0A2M6X091_9BACT|nr:MAG: hypothetical protein COT71_00550 [Candidatus Andersenbacteria bacterium CG10_big_fil_rev_8_21_14_0_10_54_11]